MVFAPKRLVAKRTETSCEHRWDAVARRVLRIEELPMAGDRCLAYQIAPSTRVSAGWPAALVGFDHLPLVFSVRERRHAESSQIAE